MNHNPLLQTLYHERYDILETKDTKYGLEETVIECSSNKHFMLDRNCDAIIFDAFIIPNNVNLCDITSFQIMIGGTIIFDIPWDIIKINSVRLIDTNYYVSICDKIFSPQFNDNLVIKNKFIFPLVSSQKQDIYFVLISKDNNFEYKIMVNNIFYNSPVRKYLSDDKSYYFINEYRRFEITHRETYIGPESFLNGFYVKTTSPIVNYRLLMNGDGNFYVFMNKDKNSISHNNNLQNITYHKNENGIDNHIAEYIYWFPIDKYNEHGRAFRSLYKIELKTQDDTYNGMIYMKTMNELMFNGELCCKRFSD
jgi:hypothetical protein